MRKKIIIIPVVVCVLLIILGFLLGKNATVNIDVLTSGKIVYTYNDMSIDELCTENELSAIYDIFNGKVLYSDNPSCGLSDEIAIVVNGGQTFCLPSDSCTIIYWKEKGKYFHVSEKEMEQLHEIFEQYGAKFPCV